MDGITLAQTSPTLKTQNLSSMSPGSSWDSAITIASSPSSVSSCDGIDDAEWNSFSKSGELPSKSSQEKKLNIDWGLSTSSTMRPVAAVQEEPERTLVPTSLDSDRLHALFSKYEMLVSGQAERRERHSSPPKDDATSDSGHPETRQRTGLHPNVTGRREQQRGISKSRIKRRKDSSGGSSRPSRKKRALASRLQEYEYVHLGDARQAPNGSIEVEVFWAPIFLACDQLRGEQAIEEAKDLVINKFGPAVWEREKNKLG